MSKSLKLVTLAAAATLALPAAAAFEYVGGDAGWQLGQHKYEIAGGQLVMSHGCDQVVRAALAPKAAPADGFEYVGGEAGWQLAQHKYDFVDGKFVMSDECDHAIRTASAPTPAEVEKARRFSPGA